jgi:hypothetical protein
MGNYWESIQVCKFIKLSVRFFIIFIRFNMLQLLKTRVRSIAVTLGMLYSTLHNVQECFTEGVF